MITPCELITRSKGTKISKKTIWSLLRNQCRKSKLKFCNNKKAKLVIMRKCLRVLKRLQSLRVIPSKSLKSTKDQAIKRNILGRLIDRKNRMSGNQGKILKEKETKSFAILIEKQNSKSRIDDYKSTITRCNRN